MRKWKIIGVLSVIILIVFVFAFGESDKPLLNQPFVVQNWSNKIITLVNGSASADSIMVHDDTGNGVRRIAPLATHLSPYALTSSIPSQFNPIAGTGINLTGTYPNITFTNASPDQTVSLTGANGITASGTYPNFTISRKKQETSSGTTNASGQYTFTFAQTYSVAPNVQANIINGTDSQIIRISTPSTTAVTVTVRNRTDVVGLLPSWSNVNGANVDVLVTEK